MVGGWYDSDLTSAGARDAQAIAHALRSAIPDGAEVQLFSSDLLRARRTADAVAEKFGVTPILDRRLREKSYGDAGGQPVGTHPFIPPPETGDRMGHHEGVSGAETKATVAERIYAAMDDILRRPCEHQIIATHGYALTFIVASWIKMPIDSLGYVNLRAPSGSITTLREDDLLHNRQVHSLGATAHLST